MVFMNYVANYIYELFMRIAGGYLGACVHKYDSLLCKAWFGCSKWEVLNIEDMTICVTGSFKIWTKLQEYLTRHYPIHLSTERKDIFIIMSQKTGWVELLFKMCCHGEVENMKSESNGTYFTHYHGLCFLVKNEFILPAVWDLFVSTMWHLIAS